jgi:hypothetical protein
MNNYENGEIWGWNGGECPVHPESKVTVWLRGKSGSFDRSAGQLRWGHFDTGGDVDIVCFQVIKPYVEPKVLWVNEHHYGACYGYTSEELAKSRVSISAVRIAVEYVEKQK